MSTAISSCYYEIKITYIENTNSYIPKIIMTSSRINKVNMLMNFKRAIYAYTLRRELLW